MELFDLHCDTVGACFDSCQPLKSNTLDIDLTRGAYYAPWRQVFAVWVPDTVSERQAFPYTIQRLKFAHEELTGQECVTPLFAVENGKSIGKDIDNIGKLASLGVKIMTLTWNGENRLGNGCLSENKEGLTPFGKEAVKALEKVAVIPDVSHLNEAGFWDTAAVCKGVFIASHSCSKTICDHPRNLTDTQFQEICRRGGVVGVNFCGEHLGESSFEKIEQHLEWFWQLENGKGLCLGGDLDGTALPFCWRALDVYRQLAEFLYKKGWKMAQIRKIFWENALNFFTKEKKCDKIL